MVMAVLDEIDFIEELRMRRWARENYVPRTQRNATWHPIVCEEMARKDSETDVEETVPQYA
jgi:hypothetical protein